MRGRELLTALEGPPPHTLHPDARCPYVSDVQHEMYRQWRVYARPFWAIQGTTGGHQVRFSPWQQNVLLAKGLPHEPPTIGALPFAPFDERVVHHLEHLNRLHQLDDSLERLARSATKEAADAEMDTIQREIRVAESRFIEEQMTPIVDMSSSLARGVRPRSEHADQLVWVAPGKAAEAADAYDEYLQTGHFPLRDVTGQRSS